MSLQHDGWSRPHPRYRLCAVLKTLVPFFLCLLFFMPVQVVGIGMAGASSVPAFILSFIPMLIIGLLGVALSFKSISAAFTTRYRLLDDQIEYHQGFLARTSTALPYSRIQTVTVRNGVIDRLFGLVSVDCQSAADLSGGVVLPGIREADAAALVEHVRERVDLARAGSGPLI